MAEEVERPLKVKFYPTGPEYVTASAAAKYIGRSFSQLFQLYPSLYRRQAGRSERRFLETNGFSVGPIVTLLLAEEAEAIFESDENAYLLKKIPDPIMKQVPHQDTTIELARSVCVPDASRHAIAAGKPATPRNPLAPFFRRPNGLASATDDDEECLAPIHLNLEKDNVRLRDGFLWNVNDQVVPLSQFAQVLVQDHELPSSFVPLIISSMQSQISSFKQMQVLSLASRHALIRVEVQKGSILLADTFEWSHASTSRPENFAQIMCQELGLGQEWVVHITFAIHDQILQDRRAAVLDDVPEALGRAAHLNCVTCFRTTDFDFWSPTIVPLSSEEANKKEISEDREIRRRRRGGGRVKDDDKSTKRSAAVVAGSDEPVLKQKKLEPSVRVRAYLLSKGLSPDGKGVGPKVLNRVAETS